MNSWISRNLFLWPATRLRGERIYDYLKLYRDQQWLTAHDIQDVQYQALAALLESAQKSSTFHRSRIQCSEPWTPSSAADALPTIEPMTKADLSDRINDIVTRKPGFLDSRKTTGGSTGQPVSILKHADALARERAATYRAYEWAGISPGDSQARFWGVPHTKSRRYFYLLADLIANRKRFSAFGFDEETLERYYRALVAFKPSYLYGYVSMLRHLAEYVTESDLPPPAVKAVITTSEVLTSADRATLTRAFAAPVFNEYGCGEVGSIAHECAHGSLHIMAENLIIELLDERGNAVQEGEIVVTDLHNRLTPLIRYRLGDFAARAASQCACGRGLPTLERVYGRAYDMIETPEGLRLHPESVIYVFEMLKEEGAPIKQFQVEQLSTSRLVVRIVAESPLLPSYERRLRTLVARHLSSTLVLDIANVPDIPRESSGKLRIVKGLRR